MFVYLGMACVRMAKMHMFDGTVWRLTALAIGACFLGRTHVFLGAHLTNRHRTPASSPPPISASYQLIMWLSGLRGGVAFAIAALSYKHVDFPQHCGGVEWLDSWRRGAPSSAEVRQHQPNDSKGACSCLSAPVPELLTCSHAPRRLLVAVM